MRKQVDRRSVLALAVLSVLTGSPSFSQESEKQPPLDFKLLIEIIDRLRFVTEAVASKFKGRSESDWVLQVVGDTNGLAELVTKVGKVSRFYGEMLSYDLLLFEKANEESDWTKAVEYIRAAYDDITEKFVALKSDFEMQASIDDLDIPVEVNTVQKGRPVNELYIHFYMRGLPDAPAPFIIFGKPTTPTQERVPPGRYIVHVLDNNEKLRQMRDADVGGNGELVRIEIPIR